MPSHSARLETEANSINAKSDLPSPPLPDRSVTFRLGISPDVRKCRSVGVHKANDAADTNRISGGCGLSSASRGLREGGA